MLPMERLVSWNLFYGASAWERDEICDEQALHDFCTFVDLFCLVDQLVVLGEPDIAPFADAKTDFFCAIRDYGITRILSLDDAELNFHEEQIRRHLLFYFGEKNTRAFNEWWSSQPRRRPERTIPVWLTSSIPPLKDSDSSAKDELARLSGFFPRAPGIDAIVPHPHYFKYWLRRFGYDTSRRTIFVRGLLYLSVSERYDLIFCPDSWRCQIVSRLVRREGDLLTNLLSTMKGNYEKFPKFSPVIFRRRVSPLAAVLLRRSGGDPGRLLMELLAMRNELASTRHRLAKIDATIRTGPHDEAVAQNQEWNRIIGEVGKSYGAQPKLFDSSLLRYASLSDDSKELFDDTRSPVKWGRVLATIGLDPLIRYWRRLPLLQLHRLRPELPLDAELKRTLSRLFGSEPIIRSS